MPARNMFFTFNKDVKVNKETVKQFVEDYRESIEESFKEIKKEFKVNSINEDFLKKFIKELKGFSSVSATQGESHGKQKIVINFIRDILRDETSEATEVLGIRYLYDEWNYDGCGYDDYDYFTYTDDTKMIKKTIKEVKEGIDKLKSLGVEVEFIIK